MSSSWMKDRTSWLCTKKLVMQQEEEESGYIQEEEEEGKITVPLNE
jgi:hypothetical protein